LYKKHVIKANKSIMQSK